MTTPNGQARNPLHGITLERMLTELVAEIGWPAMGQRIKVRCFTHDPSIPSSLRFLRKTPWAREKVESMYLYLLRERARRVRAASGTLDDAAADPMADPMADADDAGP